MKAFQNLAHPLGLVARFLLILKSGERFGGFYILYKLFALSGCRTQSLLAIAGICLLIGNYWKFTRVNKYVRVSIVNLPGVGMLLASLFTFFYYDKPGYNSATFDQPIPQTALGLFAILSAAFIVCALTVNDFGFDL